MNDEYYMRKALNEAEKAFELDEIPVGAVIVCQDRVVAKAHNLTEQLTDVTAHAEMQAFTAAADYIGGKYLKDCTLYVTLEPCVMCSGAAYWTQIGRIVYGASDPGRGFSSYEQRMLHPKTKITKGILEEETKDILTRFFARKR